MRTVLSILGLIVAAGAAGAVLGKLVGIARRVARRLDALDRVIQYELTPNHGASMKDQSTKALTKLDQLDRRVAGLEAGWKEHLEQSARVMADLYGQDETR